MNLIAVRLRVEVIRSLKHDPEATHSEEDRLHRNILQAIADGRIVNAQACCREAIEAYNTAEHLRWMA